uniref:Uncharacterized protein n=1 Tax=Arundo donax TaxID=35708 RepID=A0A0A9D7X9_ARUDO
MGHSHGLDFRCCKYLAIEQFVNAMPCGLGNCRITLYYYTILKYPDCGSCLVGCRRWMRHSSSQVLAFCLIFFNFSFSIKPAVEPVVNLSTCPSVSIIQCSSFVVSFQIKQNRDLINRVTRHDQLITDLFVIS